MREEVEDEGRGGSRAVHEECHGTATQIRARVAPIRVIQ